MKFLVAVLFVAAVNAKVIHKRQSGQNPKVFSALDILRGGPDRQLSVDQIQDLFYSVRPGQDFPLISEIPKANIDCASVKPGFYADTEGGQCQVFNRCDVNGNLTSYLCPNMTLFNQITLVCDWWYNIDCSQAKQFYDYTNSRLYTDSPVPLLDDEMDYVMGATGAVIGVDLNDGAGQNASGKKHKKSKHKKSHAA